MFNYDDIIKFRVGAKVQKVKGYKYPGVVVSVFRTLKRQVRYVVEADGDGYEGMLHIFNNEQLEDRK
jgi:uncharacterized protein YjhX (UPF0386 family)